MLKITTTYPKATRVLTAYKKYVVQQSKSNLTKAGHKASGSLYGSIKGYVNRKFKRDIKGMFLGGTTMPSASFEMLDYGKFVDEGVQGTNSNYVGNSSPNKFGKSGATSVPVGPIKQWLQRKGLDTKLAFVIARSIYQKGIKRSLFFTKPFEARYKPMMMAYHSAIADDIANNVAMKLRRKLKKTK